MRRSIGSTCIHARTDGGAHLGHGTGCNAGGVQVRGELAVSGMRGEGADAVGKSAERSVVWRGARWARLLVLELQLPADQPARPGHLFTNNSKAIVTLL